MGEHVARGEDEDVDVDGCAAGGDVTAEVVVYCWNKRKNYKSCMKNHKLG